MKFCFRVVVHVIINLVVVLSFFPILWRNVINLDDVNHLGSHFLTMLSIVSFLVIPLIPLPLSSLLNHILHRNHIHDWEEAEWISLHVGNICATVLAYAVLFYPRDSVDFKSFFNGDSALAHVVIVAEFLLILIGGLIAHACLQSGKLAGRHFFRLAINASISYLSIYYISFVTTMFINMITSFLLMIFMPFIIVVILLDLVVPALLCYWWIFYINDWLDIFDWAKLEERDGFYSQLIGVAMAALATVIEHFKVQYVSKVSGGWIAINIAPNFSFYSFLTCLGVMVACIFFRYRRQRKLALQKQSSETAQLGGQ